MSAEKDSLGMLTVLEDIREERRRQVEKWGVQSHPDLSDFAEDGIRHWYGSMAENWKKMNDSPLEGLELDWRGILLEEVFEAIAEESPTRLRAELVQVAAVAVAWIEDIDSRGLPVEHLCLISEAAPGKYRVACSSCDYSVNDMTLKRAQSLGEIHSTPNQVTWSRTSEGERAVITDSFAPGATPESLIKGGWVPHIERSLA
jgi:hypothetical protein